MGLIEKIMRWLRCVTLKVYDDTFDAIREIIIEASLYADIKECDECYIVGYFFLDEESWDYPIKSFYFDDDKEFALLQAEELCEMINNS